MATLKKLGIETWTVIGYSQIERHGMQPTSEASPTRRNVVTRAFVGALLAACLITIICTAVGLAFSDSQVGNLMLWQVPWFVDLAGNGPLLGYDSAGNPMYEGTPVHELFALIGLAAGVPIYTIAMFPFTWLYFRSKAAR